MKFPVCWFKSSWKMTILWKFQRLTSKCDGTFCLSQFSRICFGECNDLCVLVLVPASFDPGGLHRWQVNSTPLAVCWYVICLWWLTAIATSSIKQLMGLACSEVERSWMWLPWGKYHLRHWPASITPDWSRRRLELLSHSQFEREEQCYAERNNFAVQHVVSNIQIQID